MTKIISHFIILGDSASDTGVTNSRSGIVRFCAGLTNSSPLGRFSNSRVWVDYLALLLSHRLSINKLKKSGMLNATDISDGVIHQDKNITAYVHTPKYERHIDIYYNKNLFFRNYSEGGVTAVNYKWKLADPKRFIYRLSIPALEDKTAEVFCDDKKYAISAAKKAETLVLDFISANDVLQAKVQFKLSKVKKVIQARVNNIEKYIKNGYQHFIFFNAIDLSLTPRYFEQINAASAKKFCNNLNINLIEAIQYLKIKYPNCTFNIFDINAVFNNIYNNPEKFQFDKAKIHNSFKDSADFKPVTKNQHSHAEGYLFWDTVHPSDSLHFRLAEALNDFILTNFHIQKPSIKPKTFR